jgi:rod shape-determining protein MreC
MPRSNNIHIGQLVLLLIISSVLLWSADKRSWLDMPRGFLEEKILRIRVDHRESDGNKLSRLESKVIALEQDLALLQDENNALRRQLEAPLMPSLSFIPTYVISIDESDTDVVMSIAAGSSVNITTDMPVVSEAILIGRIMHSTPRMSQVRLLSSPESKIAVKTARGSQGLIVGSATSGISGVLLDRVLQNEALEEGDMLFTSGEDGLPVNLLVGKVTHIISEAREPYKRAEVSLVVDPRELTRVFVVGE